MEKIVPIIPIRDGIIFPSTDSVLTFGRPKSLAALESAFAQQDRIVCFALQRNARLNDPSPDDLSDLIASALDLKPQERQELLEMINVKKRLQTLTELLAKEIKILELERRIASKTQERFEKGAREAMLRERLRTIEEELGEKEENSETRSLLTKIKAAKMPEEVEEKAKKELSKLQNMNQYNPEAGYIRNYLDLMVALPWSEESKDNAAIKDAEKILDEDH